MSANVVNKVKTYSRDIVRNKQKLIKILSIAVILALAIVLKLSNTDTEEINIESAVQVADTDEYYIDIGGAVVKPGVYKVAAGTRLFEVVELAGGLRTDADTNTVNQAAIVEDGAKIIIPIACDDSDLMAQSHNSTLVNINLADKSQLCTLPGIGDAIADRIIEYRASNRFTKKEDIMSVKGIGKSIYEGIEESITY
jgi:competence protein ComEA